MKRTVMIFILSFLLSVSLVSCIAERKTTQPESISQERCELPVWNVGDYWKYELLGRRWWSEKVVGVKKDMYIVETGKEREGLIQKPCNL